MSKILIFGDICPTQDYRCLFNDGIVFSEEILQEISQSDMTIGNLECPATYVDRPIIKTGPNLRAYPSDIDFLSDVGFDIMSLANNHILDYGAQGLTDTISNLQRCGIEYFGAGINSALASQPLIKEVQGLKVGLISFAEKEFNIASESTPGANLFNPYSSFDAIIELKNKTDYVIVLYHGGIEYYGYPSPLLQKKCRKMVDSGADIVSVQHSHCIGSMEVYAGCPIIYGQGNSVFGYREKSKTWNEGWLIEADPISHKVGLRLMQATTEGVYFAAIDYQKKRRKDFDSISTNLGNRDFINKSWDDFCRARKNLVLPQVYGRGKWFNRLNRLTNGYLMKLFYGKASLRITMNMIRCEAHHEVVSNVLENECLK